MKVFKINDSNVIGGIIIDTLNKAVSYKMSKKVVYEKENYSETMHLADYVCPTYYTKLDENDNLISCIDKIELSEDMMLIIEQYTIDKFLINILCLDKDYKKAKRYIWTSILAYVRIHADDFILNISKFNIIGIAPKYHNTRVVGCKSLIPNTALAEYFMSDISNFKGVLEISTDLGRLILIPNLQNNIYGKEVETPYEYTEELSFTVYRNGYLYSSNTVIDLGSVRLLYEYEYSVDVDVNEKTATDISGYLLTRKRYDGICNILQIKHIFGYKLYEDKHYRSIDDIQSRNVMELLSRSTVKKEVGDYVDR